MKLGLSEEQLLERRKGVGGSDVGRVMAGDWRALWAEKTGRTEPEDLSNNLAVQMGSATEAFNAYWFERQTGRPILHRNELVVSPRYSFMRANLDGITSNARGAEAYWDAKHVGRLDEAAVLRYTPQMTHCCTILGLDWWVLSAFIGNSKWEMVEQEVHPLYQAELIARELEFWGYVERDEEPPAGWSRLSLAPKPTPKLRVLDVPVDVEDPVFKALALKDNWLPDVRRLIYSFAGTEAAFKGHAIVREDIKKLVPETVGRLTCGLYKFTRAKDGKVTQAMTKTEADDDGYQ